MARATGKAESKFFLPHIHSRFSIEGMMWDVVISLIPAGAAAIVFLGQNAVWIILISLVTGILAELFMNLLTGREISVLDGSPFVTAILFAYNLPIGTPWYAVVTGCFFAIAIVKWAFGGLGQNFMNPAFGGKIFLLAAWPGIFSGLNALALENKKMMSWESFSQTDFSYYWNLIFSNKQGCIGEVSILALLIGFAYLLARRVISPVIPVIYILTVALLSWIFGGLSIGTNLFTGNPLYPILTGTLILGACFMATDPVTTPLSLRGKIIFAICLGIVTVAIRLYGSYSEAVCYAIVLLNIFVPLIDKFTRERIYGSGRMKNE